MLVASLKIWYLISELPFMLEKCKPFFFLSAMGSTYILLGNLDLERKLFCGIGNKYFHLIKGCTFLLKSVKEE